MLSNRVKRNGWLTLAVLSASGVIDRAIRLFDGTIEWWEFVFSLLITALCVRFYLCYRIQVKRGNLFGRINVFKCNVNQADELK